MAGTGQGFQWWSRATAGMPSWSGCSGNGEGEQAVPGSAGHGNLAGLPRVNRSWWLQREQGQVGDSGERGQFRR